MKKRITTIIFLCTILLLSANQAECKLKVGKPAVCETEFLHNWKLIGNKYEKLRVEVFRLPKIKGEKLRPTRMRISSGTKILYSKDEVGIEPLYIMNLDKDKLLTVWGSYSPYYSVRIFGFRNGKLEKLLTTGTKFYPEIVYPSRATDGTSNNLEARVITVTQSEFSPRASEVPTEAFVFRWDKSKNSYDEGTAVDWNKRLLFE